MTNKTINIQGLNFHYGKQPVLQDINLSVYAGSIFGLVGHNGAGKTTLIKILVTLLSNYNGKVELFGLDVRHFRLEVLRKIGSLVESPGLYLHLTGQENMRIRATLLHVPGDRIESTLRIVGLYEVRNILVSKYSHGMKQRLGLALALLDDPQLLILDEPINGLDPTGIKEFRILLKKLSNEGKTIFLSSHFLTELEKTVDELAIIDHGKVLFNGSVEELWAMGNSSVLWRTNNSNTCESWLSSRFKFHRIDSTHVLATEMGTNDIAAMNNWLVNQGVEVYAIQHQQNNLEDIFFKLTNAKR